MRCEPANLLVEGQTSPTYPSAMVAVGYPKRKGSNMATNTVSARSAHIGKANKKGGLYSNIKKARSSFEVAGKHTLQGWVFLFLDKEDSGQSTNEWAIAHDGEVFGEMTLRTATVNKYFGLIAWALRNDDWYLGDDEPTVLDLVGCFDFVTQIEALKPKKESDDKPKKSDPVGQMVRKVQKMTKAQQNAFRKQMGW